MPYPKSWELLVNKPADQDLCFYQFQCIQLRNAKRDNEGHVTSLQEQLFALNGTINKIYSGLSSHGIDTDAVLSGECTCPDNMQPLIIHLEIKQEERDAVNEQLQYHRKIIRDITKCLVVANENLDGAIVGMRAFQEVQRELREAMENWNLSDNKDEKAE